MNFQEVPHDNNLHNIMTNTFKRYITKYKEHIEINHWGKDSRVGYTPEW